MKKISVILSVLLFPIGLMAQLETSADFRRQVYDYEFSGGIMFHTRGYGISFRWLKFTDGYHKLGGEFDMVSIRHPKEIKFPSQYYNSSARSFVYGKLNSFFNARMGLAREKIIVDKTDQGSVSISWLTSGGASFGFLKPVYLEVIKESATGSAIKVTNRYNPEIHDYINIYGQAPFFTGINETELRMGLYIKTGFSFDYNWLDDKVTSLEVGLIVDYFPQWFGLYPEGGVPIMHQANNYEIWAQFYLTINFGKKWN